MNKNIDVLRDKSSKLTEFSGVYLMKDNSAKIIYVGKAKNLKKRVSSYFRDNANHDEKVKKMVSNVKDFDYIVTDSEFEALVLECSLIKQYNPKYNILLKDSKGYHYVKISNEDYPKITAAKQILDDKATYLGPYTNSYSVKQAVGEVNKVLSLPTCHKKFPQDFNKGRPCLNYFIKQCSGLCKNKISQKEYGEIIKEGIDYLKHGSVSSVENLTKQMECYSENLEFEKAAQIRDRINAIQRITQKQNVVSNKIKNQDVFAFAKLSDLCCVSILKFRNFDLVDKQDIKLGEVSNLEKTRRDLLIQYYSQNEIPKQITVDGETEEQELVNRYLNKISKKNIIITVPKKGHQNDIVKLASKNASEQLTQRINRKGGREVVALEELSKLLGLKFVPDYIEAYDISNLKDSSIVAGMVVFKEGKPFKKGYKRFAIKHIKTQDDYGCMKEVIVRRLNRYNEEKENAEGFGKLPDLILLDGGKGHVSTILPVIKSFGLDIPVFGMVKDAKHKTRAIAKDGGEIDINFNKNAFYLVTKIQDEVHRFSLAYQQKQHKKNSFSMELTKIDGIGEKKALSLITHFKTISNLKNADIESIVSVAKINFKKAKEVYEFIQTI